MIVARRKRTFYSRHKSSRKKRDALFKKIVWVCVFLAVVFVGYRLRETPYKQTQSTPKASQQEVSTEVAEGYESFQVEALNVSFQYPEYQAPLRAVNGTSSALLSVNSRDFLIEFYESSGFVLYPWSPEDASVFCTYDGALHSFAASVSGECSFLSLQTSAQPIFYTSFLKNNTHKHVAILPASHRQYFMVITANYIEDCGQNQDVCQVRSTQKLEALLTFTSQIVEKNHNLFTQ